MGTVTLMPAVPPSPVHHAHAMYADDANNHVLREDGPALARPVAQRPPVHAPSAFAPPAHASPSVGADPYVAIREMLWLLPGISEIVKNTLERMEKAFAYNSVFFLKSVLDLQSTYLTIRPRPEPAVVLDTTLVLRIAETLSGRLTRREKDVASPSRELQLRTLISALTLLYQRDEGKLDNDTYAKLLRDVSERDAENGAKHHQKAYENKFRTGENEFLTRYACDLIRCMPSDIDPLFEDLNSETIHFIFAAGFINQLGGQLSPKIDEVYTRITAAPSDWHKDIRSLYEGTATAISMHQQSRPGHPSRAAANLAAEVARSVMDKVEEELRAYKWNSNPLLQGMLRNRGNSTVSAPRPALEAQLFVCGLLDLLNQLIATFPKSEETVSRGKALALRLIRRSEERVFRYKAFETIICSTVGYSEKSYYATMRDLETEIEETSRASGYFDSRTDEQKTEATSRVDQLKKEKREAMDRCEKKMILFKGASESMHRRLQQNRSRGLASQTIDEVARLGTPWDDEERSATTASPVPSSLQSQVPTLDSVGHSCDSANGGSPSATPTCEGTTLSPSMCSTQTVGHPSTACRAMLSPAESYRSVFSPVSPMESPVLPGFRSPATPYEAHEAITPGLPGIIHDTTFSDFAALFSGTGLGFLEDGSDIFGNNDDDLPAKDSNVRKLSIELPIQTFDTEENEQEQAQANMSREMPFRKKVPERRVQEERDPEPSTGNGPEAPGSPTSMVVEPSLSRTATGSSLQAGALRRNSRGPPARPNRRRIQSLKLDKPLPPIVVPERNKYSILAERAPEPVAPNMPPVPVPPRSQSAMEMRNMNLDIRRMSSSSSLGMRPGDYRGFTPMTPIVDNGCESLVRPLGPTADYAEKPIETTMKVHAKDTCIKTVISTDTRHAIFVSPHSFQVFTIPTPDEILDKRPKLCYRLGENEGVKKNKTQMAYRGAAASERHVVTITSQQMQVHDLHDDCKVVFTDTIKGWEFSCVTIGADKIALGLRMNLKSESAGTVRIYRMNAPTYDGPPFERWGKDIHLPINPRHPQDAPHLLTLSADGHYLTSGTPKFGYYFAWNIARIGEPRLLANGRLRRYEGPGAETLTGATLFPDAQHVFCSTFPTSLQQPEWGGSFTEPVSNHIHLHHPHRHHNHPHSNNQQGAARSHRTIRQVSLRVNASAVAPHGNGAAFLSKNGTIWITPMAFLDGDDNLTSFAPTKSTDRLQPQGAPELMGAGAVRFSPAGERLVAIDRKGKMLLLNFPMKNASSSGLAAAAMAASVSR